jgi:hypothetical protein
MKVGSLLGVRSNEYLTHINRFNLTKDLILSASEKERNMVRRCTDALLKRTWKHKANWGLKAGLTFMSLYSLCKANESNNLNNLRKGKDGCELQFYRSSIISFGLLGASMILI